MKRIQVVLLLFAIVPMFAITKAIADNNNQPKTSKFVYHGAGNPYLPLWEHLPDGEPRVFEDPDNPGKFRAYIIGSHDVRLRQLLRAGHQNVVGTCRRFNQAGVTKELSLLIR